MSNNCPDNNHVTTKLVSELDISNMCCETYLLHLGQHRVCILPHSPPSNAKNVFCLFNHNNGIRLEMVIVLSGSQFTVSGMKPIWAPFKIMQISISSDLPAFSPNFPLFTALSAHRAFLSFLRVEWKVSLFLRIKAEEKPGPGLIHVAHTGGMLCMDNWLLKQHGHCWILMVLPKCHLTDVTAAPILKRLVSKTSIWAHSSPTVSGRDSTVCQASISERQISHLQPYLHRTVHPLP